jgi:primosomal replication protein N
VSSLVAGGQHHRINLLQHAFAFARERRLSKRTRRERQQDDAGHKTAAQTLISATRRVERPGPKCGRPRQRHVEAACALRRLGRLNRSDTGHARSQDLFDQAGWLHATRQQRLSRLPPPRAAHCLVLIRHRSFRIEGSLTLRHRLQVPSFVAGKRERNERIPNRVGREVVSIGHVTAKCVHNVLAQKHFANSDL